MASSSKEMELAIKIAGKVESSFTSALGKAGSGVKALTKTISAATAAAAAAVGAIGVAAINVGKEFESAMSQVQATMLLDTSTAEGAAAMATLEDAARECGRTTAFSATEAAEALNYLALAGYDADKAAAALPSVLQLAGAGAMDLAAASDMVTDSMSALGIEATKENLTLFSDQLAQTASKSNTSVAQLGEAILTVGGTAKSLSGGTAELNTALGILADNGIKGAEGGTALRNVLLSLQAPTDKGAQALKALGVEVYDAKGNMRPLNDVLNDFNKATATMSDEARTNAISQIFNKRDLKSVNALLANSGQRWDELSGQINNCAGACENMYAIQLDNLDGDIKVLQSGLSDLGISIYKDLNGPLREMTQLGTSMVEELSKAYSEGGMAGMVGAVGDCLSEAVNVIAGYAPQVVSMGVDLISSFVQGIADNAGQLADMAAQVLTIFINGLFTLIPQVLLAGIDIITQLANSIASQLPTLIENGTQAVVNLIEGIIQKLPDITASALTVVQTLADSIGDNAPKLLTAAIELIGTLAEGLLSMLPDIVAAGLELVVSLIEGILNNLPMILNTAVQVITSLIDGIVNALPTIIQMGIQLVITLIQGIINNLPQIIQAAVQIVMSLITGLIQARSQLIAAIPQLIAAIIETIFTTNWLQVGMDILTGIITGIVSMVPGLMDAVKAIPEAFSRAWESIKSIFSNVFGFFKGVWDTVVGVFTTIGVAISDAISGAVKGAINKVLSGAIGIINGFISGINAVIGVINAIPGVNIGKINKLEVPQLATGGVIDQPTLAMVGEGKQTEAVLPLDTLWGKMKSLLSDTIRESGSGGGNVVETLLQRLQGIGTGGGGGGGTGGPELAGAGGPNISYAPVYNLYGSATKEDAVEAERLSQAEFNKMMKQWQRENDRTKF